LDIREPEEKVAQVSDVYAKKFEINRDHDWFLLKIQEELGELTSAHLKLSQRARIGTNSQDDLKKNLKDEIADVLAMTVLYARHRGINIEEALQEKWFKYL